MTIKLYRLVKGISRHITLFVFISGIFFFTIISFGQNSKDVDVDVPEAGQNIAPVKIDGNVLFFVRGISSYPAEFRATTINNRIIKAADDRSIAADSVKIIPADGKLQIFAGKEFIMNIYDEDAKIEGINKTILAELIQNKTSSAINKYRYDRSKDVLIKNSIHALGAAVLLVIVLFLLMWFIRRINSILQNRIKEKIEKMESKTFKLIKSNQLWKAFHVFFRTTKIILIVIITAGFINYILGLFPWTNGISIYTLHLFTNPFLTIARDFVKFLPSLAFLIVIFFMTRYLLKLIKLLFTGIAQGGIVIKDFDPEWAMATYKIFRVFVFSIAVIIAYPYIPGSDSSAFKGVSVFLGVLFSLGSSSFIGNLIAGYSMTYRGAFKKGDRIQVDHLIGFVEDQKLLVTRLRSVKNEEIIIPNSVLLNSNIINFNTKAKEQGVILHTSVGIGYETPWRQVDAILKLAADRTEGLMKEPAPFVLKKSLGDFAVEYEINAYCKDVPMMHIHYTILHQHILDLFNENNIQIMTPAYEMDPETPKVVPKDQWNTPLAGNGNVSGS